MKKIILVKLENTIFVKENSNFGSIGSILFFGNFLRNEPSLEIKTKGLIRVTCGQESHEVFRSTEF